MLRRDFLSLATLAFLPQQSGREGAPPLADVVADLVAGNHILAQEGILDGYGHISVRHPGNRERFLLARSVAPELVTTADILEFGLNGEPVDAKGKTPYKERFIHSEIYRARADVNAVVLPHAVPDSVRDSSVPLRPISPERVFAAVCRSSVGRRQA